MNFNATPVENLPQLPPQQNDPRLMSQIMQDAHMDNRPNAYEPHVQPSYQPPPPTVMEPPPQPNSFIPDFNLEMIFEKLKEPLIVAVVYLVLSSDALKGVLEKNLPDIFLGEDAMKQLLVKAGLAGAGYFLIKHLLKQQ